MTVDGEVASGVVLSEDELPGEGVRSRTPDTFWSQFSPLPGKPRPGGSTGGRGSSGASGGASVIIQHPAHVDDAAEFGARDGCTVVQGIFVVTGAT